MVALEIHTFMGELLCWGLGSIYYRVTRMVQYLITLALVL